MKQALLRAFARRHFRKMEIFIFYTSGVMTIAEFRKEFKEIETEYRAVVDSEKIDNA